MTNQRVKTALVHVADGRVDFFARREALAIEEMQTLGWLHEAAEIIESPLLHSIRDVRTFVKQILASGAQSLVIHIPIWADPIFTIKLHNLIDLPILLLGNNRPDTSSMVGMLGAGGALDQIGVTHTRVFDHTKPEGRRQVLAFLRAAAAVKNLKGQTLGLFGNRSLGIFTAGADPVQWQQIFGVDIESLDQCEIVHRAEKIGRDEVARHLNWFTGNLASVEFAGGFTPKALDRQMRSYLATRQLAEEYDFDFVGVKCQPEMTDGYASQCIGHCLMNGLDDADGPKTACVHACESDADGALTMQILHHITEGMPAALMDMRWYNDQNSTWVLANCGAAPAAFFATETDPAGLGGLRMREHVFGRGGGGAIGGAFQPQEVTLARLCRRDGKYWMAILPAKTNSMTGEDLARTTAVFPQACIQANTGAGFINEFGSNHIHVTAGDYTQELAAFCTMVGIPFKIWS